MTASKTAEWLTAFGTSFAAVGTVAAVLLAIYLNAWREWRLRPKLSFTLGDYAQDGLGFERNPDREAFFKPVVFQLSNAPKRRTAHDAEVLLTIESDIQGQLPSDGPMIPLEVPKRFTHLSNRPLAWTFGPRPDGVGQAQIDIPPGVTRSVTIAYLGHPWSLAEAIYPCKPIPPMAAGSWMEVLGAFNVYPLDQESMKRIGNELYHLTFVITARDTPATRYTTDLTFTLEDQGSYRMVAPRWTPLRELRV